MKDFFKKFDKFFIDLINSKMKNRYLDVIMYRITDLGGAIFTCIFSFILVLFGNREIKLIGLEMLSALGISQLIVQGLKRTLSRERPYKILEQLNTFGINLRDYSFPSGHTTASFSIASTLALNMPRVSILVFTLAMIIGLSRIYLGVHYPTDVLAGIILGTGSSIAVHYFLLGYIEQMGSFMGIY